MSYRVQVKIEVVNEIGQAVNIKGHDVVTSMRHSITEFPLVTCDKGSTDYSTPKTALKALNNLHAVIKPLVAVAI